MIIAAALLMKVDIRIKESISNHEEVVLTANPDNTELSSKPLEVAPRSPSTAVLPSGVNKALTIAVGILWVTAGVVIVTTLFF